MTETEIAPIELIDLLPYEESDDPSKRTHVVRGEENDALWVDGMVGQDIVDAARMLGVEVTALCGHKFVPLHNPEKYPACKACLDLWSKLGS